MKSLRFKGEKLTNFDIKQIKIIILYMLSICFMLFQLFVRFKKFHYLRLSIEEQLSRYLRRRCQPTGKHENNHFWRKISFGNQTN